MAMARLEPSLPVPEEEVLNLALSVASPRKALELDRTFDFTKSEEVNPLPLHVVEVQRAKYRRHGNVPNDVSLREFVKEMGITWEDTLDPIRQTSCLEFDDSLREYYGDSDDAAYRDFRENMVRFSKWDEWLKCNHFIGKTIYDDYTLLKRFEDDALRICDPEDEHAIMAVEAEVYSEVHSEAHLESLQKHRRDSCPQQLGRRLTLELQRRVTDASQAVNTVLEQGGALAEAPPQRHWRGKSYRQSFMDAHDPK
ncbi:uncharacterized protein Tco025E_05646 [Trypanosoma conorhini]|uniref:Uncharacterized protein n=1 Tax=Trypanosoma conorhini TaxID=83891 RepID=A0A422PB71_9TRYP|nr:uncharacterized protein Tco025E_05646 [Trypanosoma conorhini]RNF14963.1 hypothetical protein Tco025E_05646 [Trypanosoma conorhini]